MEHISPFPPHPVRRPLMFQTWRWLTFIHWAYEPDAIRRLLPPSVGLDIFDGAAWIGLTPFLLVNLRPPFLPAIPWLSHFPETNVRTYVRGPDGEPGVWFFTLEADRFPAVVAARSLYQLPYRWANMRVKKENQSVSYESRRHRAFGRGGARINVETGDPMKPGDFDNFLTARFRLYTTFGKKLVFAQIEHAPWPLHHARVERLEQDLIENSGVPKATGKPILHYSPDVTVRIGRVQFA